MDKVYREYDIQIGMVCPVCGVHHTLSVSWKDNYNDNIGWKEIDCPELCINCKNNFNLWRNHATRKDKHVLNKWLFIEWLGWVVTRMADGKYAHQESSEIFPKRAYKHHHPTFIRELEKQNSI